MKKYSVIIVPSWPWYWLLPQLHRSWLCVCIVRGTPSPHRVIGI